MKGAADRSPRVKAFRLVENDLFSPKPATRDTRSGTKIAAVLKPVVSNFSNSIQNFNIIPFQQPPSFQQPNLHRTATNQLRVTSPPDSIQK